MGIYKKFSQNKKQLCLYFQRKCSFSLLLYMSTVLSLILHVSESPVPGHCPLPRFCCAVPLYCNVRHFYSTPSHHPENWLRVIQCHTIVPFPPTTTAAIAYFSTIVLCPVVDYNDKGTVSRDLLLFLHISSNILNKETFKHTVTRDFPQFVLFCRLRLSGPATRSL